MTRRPDPFMMALETLKSRAESGVFVPGEPVVIAAEAERLRLSPTPIREALAWLSGYGLIERAPTGGYLAPRLNPSLVRDQYAFRMLCLTIGLNGAGQVHGLGRVRPPTLRADDGLRDLMSRAVRGTGNNALCDAYERVSSHLALLIVAERRLFKDLEAEADAIAALFDTAPGTGLPEALKAYHHRRIEAAALLVMEAEAGRGLPPDV